MRASEIFFENQTTYQNRIESVFSNLKKAKLVAGTVLYHGTASEDDFSIPRGPAWFTTSNKTAAKWAGWHSSQNGKKRLLSYTVDNDIDLISMNVRTFNRLGILLFNDAEPPIHALADAFKRFEQNGWFADGEENEILLVNPAAVIKRFAEQMK